MGRIQKNIQPANSPEETKSNSGTPKLINYNLLFLTLDLWSYQFYNNNNNNFIDDRQVIYIPPNYMEQQNIKY